MTCVLRCFVTRRPVILLIGFVCTCYIISLTACIYLSAVNSVDTSNMVVPHILQGVPAEFADNAELADTMTAFIFISSVGHAAANFMQYDQYSFPPRYPSSLRVAMPTTKVLTLQRFSLNTFIKTCI